MKVKETIRGNLEYRSPNIFETLQIIGQCDFTNTNSMLSHQGVVIKNLEPFIDYSNLRTEDGKEYKSYDEVCNDFVLMNPLMMIANEILDNYIQGSKKKKN